MSEMEYIKDDVPITFITGGAGTGKSYTINQYIKQNSKNKNIAVTASTGIAAFNIGGQTIHSFLWLVPDSFKTKEDFSSNTAKFKNIIGSFYGQACNKQKKYHLGTIQDAYRHILNADTIIIDEISMINAEIFDYIDYLLRSVSNIKNKYGKDAYCAPPFGGKKIIIVGDMFQLPPVEGNLFFDSNVWKNTEHQTINLTTCYRQKDDAKFTDVLNRIRIGNQTDDDIKYINDRTIIFDNIEQHHKFLKNSVLLATNNNSVNKCNAALLSDLDDEEFEFIADIEIYKKEKGFIPEFQVELVLKLKRNAKIMLLRNLDVSKGLVNGAIGYCIDFENDCIICNFNGVEIPIKKEKFTITDGGREEKAACYQYPLRLAYGLTIHKSQGQTLDNILLNNPSQMTAAGQFYTAISRTKKYEMVYLHQGNKKFDKDCIVVNKKIKKWYLEEGLI